MRMLRNPLAKLTQSLRSNALILAQLLLGDVFELRRQRALIRVVFIRLCLQVWNEKIFSLQHCKWMEIESYYKSCLHVHSESGWIEMNHFSVSLNMRNMHKSDSLCFRCWLSEINRMLRMRESLDVDRLVRSCLPPLQNKQQLSLIEPHEVITTKAG